jgi:hypothetical protein
MTLSLLQIALAVLAWRNQKSHMSKALTGPQFWTRYAVFVALPVTRDIMRGCHADMGGPQIAELKDYFQESHDRSEQQTSSSTLLESDELIFGHCKYMSKQEILATVPPRQIVDRLVASFFNYEIAAPGSS